MAESRKGDRERLVTWPPSELALIIERRAAEENISVSGYITELLATSHDYELTGYRTQRNRTRGAAEGTRMSA